MNRPVMFWAGLLYSNVMTAYTGGCRCIFVRFLLRARRAAKLWETIQQRGGVKDLLQIKSGLGTVGSDVSPNKISVCWNSCSCINVYSLLWLRPRNQIAHCFVTISYLYLSYFFFKFNIWKIPDNGVLMSVTRWSASMNQWPAEDLSRRSLQL